MTRCECAELDFAEIPKRLAGEALSLEAVGRRTGCGMLCSACGPDLDRFLARARQGVTR